MGCELNADIHLEHANAHDYDMIILPGGGKGAKIFAASEGVKDFLKFFKEHDRFIAAICASPAVVLEPLGLLAGEKATCYPGMLKKIKEESRSEDPVVVSHKLITSQGPGTA